MIPYVSLIHELLILITSLYYTLNKDLRNQLLILNFAFLKLSIASIDVVVFYITYYVVGVALYFLDINTIFN
jgi:hypothetical protein